MSAVPKIIIKARGPPSRSVPPSEDDEEANVDDADAEDDPDPEDAPTPMEVDADGASASEEGAPVVVKRGRGRPRGSRGKSQPTSGTSTPRGRGRGRGRGAKPRGGVGRPIGSLTIRLPKRPDEEEEEEEDAATEGEAAEEKEPVAPLGGGKPFRKIQGMVYIIEGDEFVTEDDPKGDEKIDKWGNLLGGLWFCMRFIRLLIHSFQADGSKRRHLFCREGIQNVDICSRLTRREPLVFATLCTTFAGTLLLSNKMPHNPKKTISSRRGNLVRICAREASPSSPPAALSSSMAAK